VHGHPGYLRNMRGATPAGGRFLHIAAFDLARDAQGQWWVVAQRTQAPSGLGYLLENRTLVSRLFPEAYGTLRVQRLAASYRALVESLRAMAPAGDDEPRIALLTPGPYNETYFEHAYLARYLGLTLVEGGDLTVRGERLYLKTLRGLEPVHGLLKRLDDEFLDPLELRADSQLGVPGLMQAVRAGHLLVANAPGSAVLESSALLGFLPALSEHLLGETLSLPSLDTWWCGERAALDAVLPQLANNVIKPTYGAPGTSTVLGRALTRRGLDEWAGRLLREPDDYTVQAYQPLSQLPTWDGRRLAPRSLLLRVFAMPDGAGGWQVLPGGLTRLAGATQEIASMQRGGSSVDTWVLGDEPGAQEAKTSPRGAQAADASPLASAAATSNTPTSAAGDTLPELPASRHRVVTSRAAENLFWLGRYTERTENTARLARLTLEALGGEYQDSPPLLAWVSELASAHGLVLPGVPPATQSRRVFERSLVASLGDTTRTTSVGFNLAALRQAASSVRERLSLEHWNLITRIERDFLQASAKGDYAPVEALRLLEGLTGQLAALTGEQTDRMNRDDGWRLLSVGRHLERLGFLAAALSRALASGAVQTEGGFDALLGLFDARLGFQSLHLQRHHLPALVDLLVMDRDNPRSLGWVTQTLRGRLLRIGDAAEELAQAVPDPRHWNLATLCERDAQGGLPQLEALLATSRQLAWQLSDDLGTRFFTHSDDARRSVGA